MVNHKEMVMKHNMIVIANAIELVAESLMNVNLKEVHGGDFVPLSKSEAKSLAFKAINKRIKNGECYVG